MRVLLLLGEQYPRQYPNGNLDSIAANARMRVRMPPLWPHCVTHTRRVTHMTSRAAGLNRRILALSNRSHWLFSRK